MKAGQTKTIKIKGAKLKVKWSSSKKSVATVKSTGKASAKIRAIKKGKAVITAKMGKKKFTCKVTVKKKNNSTDMDDEEEEEPSATVSPEDGDANYPVPSDYKAKKDGVVYGQVKTDTYHSETTGKDRKVNIVLPPNYSEDKQYPVMYMCRGLGQDHTQWVVEGKADVLIGNLIASGEAEEMILVMPNCRARANDGANPADCWQITNYQAFDNFINDFQNDLKPYIEKTYSVKTGRENTAIIGFSMGGRTALHLGMKLQDTFGYVAACCPAPGIFPYFFNNVREEGLFTEDEFKIKDEYKGKTKLMIFAGLRDTVVGTYPKSYHEALEKNGSEHIWCKFSGGHDFTTSGKGLYNFAKACFK